MTKKILILGGFSSYSNGYSTHFNGLNQWLSANISSGYNDIKFSRSDPFSINVFLNLNAIGSTQEIISVGERNTERYYLQILSSGAVRFQIINTLSGGYFETITSTTNLTTGVWLKITVTYNGIGGSTGYKLYFNDVLQPVSFVASTANAVKSIQYSSLTIGIFMNGPTPNNFFNGNIDELTIWNKELTSSEISDIGSAIDPSLLGFSSNLVEHYRMGDDDTYPVVNGVVRSYNLDMVNMSAFNFETDVP